MNQLEGQTPRILRAEPPARPALNGVICEDEGHTTRRTRRTSRCRTQVNAVKKRVVATTCMHEECRSSDHMHHTHLHIEQARRRGAGGRSDRRALAALPSAGGERGVVDDGTVPARRAVWREVAIPRGLLGGADYQFPSPDPQRPHRVAREQRGVPTAVRAVHPVVVHDLSARGSRDHAGQPRPEVEALERGGRGGGVRRGVRGGKVGEGTVPVNDVGDAEGVLLATLPGREDAAGHKGRDTAALKSQFGHRRKCANQHEASSSVMQTTRHGLCGDGGVEASERRWVKLMSKSLYALPVAALAAAQGGVAAADLHRRAVVGRPYEERGLPHPGGLQRVGDVLGRLVYC